MRNYAEGGMIEEIPEGAQEVLRARREEKARLKMKSDERAENEAPKKVVKKKYEQLKNMLGLGSPKKSVNKAKGGYVSKADGCATRGKTKGRFV